MSDVWYFEKKICCDSIWTNLTNAKKLYSRHERQTSNEIWVSSCNKPGDQLKVCNVLNPEVATDPIADNSHDTNLPIALHKV